MKKKKIKVLIFGAGAIGRGFLAPLLYSKNFSITFVEVNKNLINLLKKIIIIIQHSQKKIIMI